MKNKTNKVQGVVTKPAKPSFKSLHEVFNFGKVIKYDVSSPAEYKRLITKMNIGDLQVHAVKLGLKPSRNRAMLEKTLINAFSKHQASLVPPVSFNPQIKNEKQVMDILSKGK